MRCHDAQSTVLYPTEIDDEFIADDPDDTTGIAMGQPDWKLSFLIGCNFTTDLYRILQLVVQQSSRHRTGGSAVFGTLSTPSLSPRRVLDLVEEMYMRLPHQFRETSRIGDAIDDRFSYQVVNIVASVHLVRMIILSKLEDSSVEEYCHIARDLLDFVATVPPMYLRAMSPPLVGCILLS